MATEFNYHRAQREWATPHFKKLSSYILMLWEQVTELAATVSQKECENPDFFEKHPVMEEAFKVVDLERLQLAAHVIYYAGHWGFTQAITVTYPGLPSRRFETDDDVWSPKNAADKWVKDLNAYPPAAKKEDVKYEYHKLGTTHEQAGAYWKFQILAKKSVLARNGSLMSEGIMKKALDWPEDGFMDHKKDTDYDDEELTKSFVPAWFEDQDAFEFIKVFTSVSPHPFCIGNRHMAAAQEHGGMLGKEAMRAAPCAMRDCGPDGLGGMGKCQLDYDQHIATRVVLVRVAREVANKEAATILSGLKDRMEKYKLDAFGFDKSEFEIPKPEEADHGEEQKSDVAGAEV